jgi:nucleoside-diphosphate-sugar epimerase
MRVFVAGASGAIGQPLVRRLTAAGHEVTGMTRSADRAAEIRADGAAAVVCDVYDRSALAEAVRAARPEALVHELTALPPVLDMRRPETYEATNRLRGEGTRILLEAADAVGGVQRIVAQSVAFLYAPTGGWVKSEADPVLERIPGPMGDAARALADLEAQVLAVDGLVLRYGFFYGPGTHYAADGQYANEVRRRRLPVVGAGTGTFSFIHVDDAAAATEAALERGDPGVYNIVDDDPAPLREWLPEYASALGARRPLRVPRWLAGLVAGRGAAAMATTMRGASNAKAKKALGWQPEFESWRRGFRQLQESREQGD